MAQTELRAATAAPVVGAGLEETEDRAVRVEMAL